MADIRVDRYEVDVAANGQTLTITDVGDLSKAFIRLTGSSLKTCGGRIGNTGNGIWGYNGVGHVLTATNQVTFYRNATTDVGTVKTMFEIWTYTGPANGAYEFKVRDVASKTLLRDDLTTTEALTLITDRNACIPFITGFTTSDDALLGAAGTCNVHINSSNQIEFNRGRIPGFGTTMDYYYTIVEFTGSAWNVGHAVSTAHDTMGTAGINLTMNTDSTGTGGTTFDVTDWTTAMIPEISMGSDAGGEAGIGDILLISRPGDSTTQVRIQFGDINARNDNKAYVHILQCDDITVWRSDPAPGPNQIEEGNNTYSVNEDFPNSTIAGNLNELALEFSVSTTGTGAAHMRGQLVGIIEEVTPGVFQLKHWIHRSGNAVTGNWAAVDFSQAVDVPVSGQILKAWNGTSWLPCVIKRWNGTTWDNVKYWDGDSWQI